MDEETQSYIDEQLAIVRAQVETLTNRVNMPADTTIEATAITEMDEVTTNAAKLNAVHRYFERKTGADTE